MADVRKDLEDPQSPEQADEAFRARMRQSQEPEHQKWVSLDDSAGKLTGEIEEQTNRHRELKTPMVEAYDALSQARTDRDQWRQDNERNSANAEQWDQDYQKLDQAAVDRQRDFQGVMKNASLEDLDAMKQDIDRRRDELADTIAQRQGIALLPSERAAQEAGMGQAQGAAVQEDHRAEEQRQEDDTKRQQGMAEDDERKRRQEEEDRQELGQANEPQQQANTDELQVALPNLDEWRARQGQEQGEEVREQADQGMGQGPGGFHWRAYATSAEEAQANHQLEQDQTELAYRLGRTATTEEIDAYQAQRNQAQAGESEEAGEQTQDRAQQAQGQDRTQGNQQGHGQDGEQPAQANQPERYTLGLGQVRRQGQQAQADAGPQPNSTYSQRRAQANQAAQGQEGGEAVVDAEGLQQKRASRMVQGQGM